MALVENGTWAPNAAKAMRARFEACKDIEIVEPVVSIKSALDPDARAQLKQLAAALA